jgi:energy-coupling factor transporter transmembrane protein EcfT
MTGQTLDPRAKLVAYLLGCALILLATEPAELAVAAAVPLLLLAAARRLDRWLGLLRLLLPTLALFALVAGLTAGPAAGLGAALRLLALAAAGVLFFATTPPEELGEALQASGLSPQVAFLFAGALRFVPTLGELVGEVRDAQASRGIRVDGLHLLRNGPALLGPVLVGALRLADELAEALEARGFANPRHTLLRDYRWTARDRLLVAGMAVASAVAGSWLILT